MRKTLMILSLPILLLAFWSFHTSYPFAKPQPSFNFSIPDSSLLEPEEVHIKKATVISILIGHNHYSQKKLGDALSSEIFDRYLESLDNGRNYYLASDIERFENYRYKLDEYLKNGQLEPIYEMFNIRKQRILERFEKNLKVLDNEYDFTLDESISLERDKQPWAKDEVALDEIWRKEIKNQLLGLLLNNDDLEKSKEILKTRYERYIKSIHQFNSEDVFEMFMNAVANTFDPHTAYFSPVNSQNFNLRLRKSFEGIGARLVLDNDYTTITEIIPGGPAFKGKELQANDKIIGVAQGKKGEFQDVVGWRLDDVVSLIRGDKGTVVRLQVIPAGSGPGALPKVISLVRDKIKLEDQVATKRLITVPHKGQDYQLGVISIPSFYIDYEDYRSGNPDYRSTSNDVRKLILELKDQGMDGLIIDLRNNGGGFLKEAVDLSGLFIKEGPIVQVRNTEGRISLDSDQDPNKIYAGPLAVMVNTFSASASEIFAGAIQDYQRGIIIGEQTFGKGTVQSPINLNDYIKNEDKGLGQLNLTLAKYYRAAGSSTQHLGVTPDIELPSMYEKSEFGESSEPSALPWDEIASSDFKPEGDVNAELIKKLKASYNTRLKSDSDLKELLAAIEEFKGLRDRTEISLNLEARKKEAEAYKEQREAQNRLFQQNANKEKDSGLGDVQDLYLKNALQILLENILEQA